MKLTINVTETTIEITIEKGIGYEPKEQRHLKKAEIGSIAMDAIFKAIEKNLVNVTLWNYTPDNTHKLGDKWNEEEK